MSLDSSRFRSVKCKKERKFYGVFYFVEELCAETFIHLSRCVILQTGKSFAVVMSVGFSSLYGSPPLQGGHVACLTQTSRRQVCFIGLLELKLQVAFVVV